MDMYEMSCYKVNPNKYDLAHKGFWLALLPLRFFFKSSYIFEFLMG